MARVNKRRERNPLILIGCEGDNESEEIYFNNYKSRNCRILFSTGNSTDPKGILEDMKRFMSNNDIKVEYGDIIFMVLDTDLNKNRIDEIKTIEKECDDLGIKIIISSPTFEIWLLMHFRDDKLVFSSSKEVKKELKTVVPGYKESMDIFPLISMNTSRAIACAKKLDKQRMEDNINDKYLANPYSDVYKVIEEIESLKGKNTV